MVPLGPHGSRQVWQSGFIPESWRPTGCRLCFFSQYRPCTSAGLCFPVSSPGRSPHRDVIKINDIMSHRGPRPFRKQVLLWSGGSAAPPWVCCSSSPQGLTLEVTFMVFPVTLAVYGLPALSPAVTVLSGQLLSGLLVVPGLEGFAKISHQCFTGPCENKRAFLERGPLLLLGKTFSVRGQQRRESWCGGPWLQPPEELGTGVPQLAPLLEIVTGHSAWNRTTELQSWLCIVSHSELQNLVCYVFSTQD